MLSETVKKVICPICGDEIVIHPVGTTLARTDNFWAECYKCRACVRLSPVITYDFAIQEVSPHAPVEDDEPIE